MKKCYYFAMKTGTAIILIFVAFFAGTCVGGTCTSMMQVWRTATTYNTGVAQPPPFGSNLVIQDEPLTIETAPTGPLAVEERLEFSGSGEVETDLFMLATGVVRVEYSYSGTDWLYISVRDEAGEFVELITNETGGPQEGSMAFLVDAPGNYMLYVNGTAGDWAVVLY